MKSACHSPNNVDVIDKIRVVTGTFLIYFTTLNVVLALLEL